MTPDPAALKPSERTKRERHTLARRARLLAEIEACRREVATWPDWMRQQCTAPAWMGNHATDL